MVSPKSAALAPCRASEICTCSYAFWYRFFAWRYCFHLDQMDDYFPALNYKDRTTALSKKKSSDPDTTPALQSLQSESNAAQPETMPESAVS
jgi:hypothetical protein